MPALTLLRLSDKLACQGSATVFGVLHPEELESASDLFAVEDQEQLTFKYSRLDATGEVRRITAQMRAGRVIAVVWDDGSFDEWRIGPSTTGRAENGMLTVVCVPLWLDLVERSDSAGGKGWVSNLPTGGRRNFDYELTESTPSSILSTYVIPNCPSWVTLGTVDPTFMLRSSSLSVSRLTPGALTLAVRDALRAVDVSCEVRLRRNGTTDYKLDLVTQIGASGNTPVFHPSISLTSLTQKTDPTLQATRVLVKGSPAPDGFPGIWGIARWKGTVSGTTITLTDRNGGASPVAFDNQFVGNYLLRCKTGRTFAITSSSASGGSVTCSGGVSTSATDEDFEFRLTEPLTNTRTTTTRYAVSAVPDGTHITMAVSNPIAADSQYVDWYAKVWSAAVAGTVIATTRISGSVAATDIIAVASSAGVNNTHYVEFIQLDGAGEIPSYVDHPLYSQADPTGYGIKVMELSKQQAGISQLVPNPWFRTWTNSGNPPDGYTYVTRGTPGTNARNSNASFTRYGGYSWNFQSASALSELKSPIFYPAVTGGSDRLSARCWVYLTTFNAATNPGIFALIEATASGGAGATLGSVQINPVGTNTAGVTEVATGTWVELKIEGITLTSTSVPYGCYVSFWPGGQVSLGDIIGYCDVMEAYPFLTCPSDDFEFGDVQALLQSGNNTLADVASPPLYYTFGIRDLERTSPAEFARLKLTLGANVRAADIEYGIDATVRQLRMERNLLTDETTLTLSNKPARITQAQTNASARSSRIIAAVQDGFASPNAFTLSYVALTGSTTLPISTEIATATTSAPVVVLPSAPPTQDDGAAVTYVPSNPATTPQTTVTAGTPPSRRRTQPQLY